MISAAISQYEAFQLPQLMVHYRRVSFSKICFNNRNYQSIQILALVSKPNWFL